MTQPTAPAEDQPSRRCVVTALGGLTAVGVLGCAGCASEDTRSAAPGGAGQPGTAPAGQASANAPSASGTGGSTLTFPAADIPVGGGRIYREQRVVITQPTAGTFHAFSTVCPHAGCPVTSVTAKTIVCGCHGSVFSASTGEVQQGPATRGLGYYDVSLSGGTLTLS